MKLGLISLGCPKNLVDSEVMLGIIEKYHIEITNDPEAAEIIIVNTCGFIESAKQESIDTILSMAAYKTEGCCRYLIVTGCLAQRYAQELFQDMPEVDAIVGTNVYKDIAQVIEQVMQGQRVLHLSETDFEKINLEGLQGNERNLPDPRKLTTPSYMAYLKIAEGCDNFCSFCAIPLIRGRYTSKPYEQIMAEARELVERGVKELIVIAQDTTRYGQDLYGKLRLAELLHDLNGLSGLKWIRVLYSYPNTFTDELIEAYATLPKVCHYVDLPLQHASDRLLHAMRRRDKLSETKKLLKKLRERIPDIVIRTTFIVGFPGETEEDFAILKEFVTEQKFENAGVFQYSQEENTVAATLPEQIPEETKQERYDELMAIQAGISEDVHRSMEDRELEVVVEGYESEEENLVAARSYREAPDIDGSIFVENAPGLNPGDFIRVRIEQGFAYEVVATRV
ncbi:ribosomal protein S12 methylthiotransferase [Succiniclasticum ruminis]|uniref:Ribosomal protein uS12 methylthiotransferase RimO n=1 Tax=Succiniclasticum ruminis TaxID=40841 RepID=A0A1G6JMR0_9FIRM|nr:30S ribosomal protein S12 methylthiotransferase RimO [Succiniclasticum ruminis]SDC20020.1 ribosomal protein S12 methylthiotransferase [Succiniclasticum ruminis]